jgi:aconitase A
MDDHLFFTVGGGVWILVADLETELATWYTWNVWQTRQNTLGFDSHTPAGGGIGMLAIGTGGLDVALAGAGAYM